MNYRQEGEKRVDKTDKKIEKSILVKIFKLSVNLFICIILLRYVQNYKKRRPIQSNKHSGRKLSSSESHINRELFA